MSGVGPGGVGGRLKGPRKPADPDLTVLRAAGAAEPSAHAPRVLKSRFVLEDKLGSGGMGTVFRAKDLRKVEARDRNPYVAVKVLNNDFREHPEAFIALQREASKSQGMSHPNIVSIYDFDKDGELPFMTMELLEGRELAELLRAYPSGLPSEMAWPIIEGMCDGLSHAHENHIVHADFKPGNVFVTQGHKAKILDFGIARAVQFNKAHGEDTVFDPANFGALTPAFASREMLRGDNPELRDDLYSLGIVIYQILTGHHPFGRLSAEEAHNEGLRPEKPRGINRRQWLGLQRCLAFHRADRAQSVAEVINYLFKPAPWRSRTALAAAAAFVIAIGGSMLIGDPTISEVKEEVRQSTLVEAQVARLTSLMHDPRFDAPWEELVWAETQTLLALEGPSETTAALTEGITSLYASRIEAEQNFDAAAGLYRRGSRFGDLGAQFVHLLDRKRAELDMLLEAPDAADFHAHVSVALGQLADQFSHTPEFEDMRLHVGARLAVIIDGTLEEGEYERAQQLFAVYAGLDPEAGQRSALEARLLEAATRFAEEQVIAAQESRAEALQQQLAESLSGSCLRLDLAGAAALLPGGDSRLRRAGRAQIGGRVSACLERLLEVDAQKAADLHRQVARLFGELPGVDVQVFDPCGMRYLVGNGGHSGRGSYCADELDGGYLGPRLVVVPDGAGGRFAITKQEITWGQFEAFCAETGACGEVRREELPVTSVTFDEASAFARWLSSHTGYRYRLPSLDEWRQAAIGAPDPNRNCRVKVGGVQRGLGLVAADTGRASGYGLLHTLGNAQEWVETADGLQVVGGAFRDPIAQCIADTARQHDGVADDFTGFRLVREVT